MKQDLALYNGKITTLNPQQPEVSALGITDGRIVAAGTDDEVLSQASPETKRIDLHGRRVIPGLNDSHHASDPWRPQLQPGAALGRRAVACGRAAAC